MRSKERRLEERDWGIAENRQAYATPTKGLSKVCFRTPSENERKDFVFTPSTKMAILKLLSQTKDSSLAKKVLFLKNGCFDTLHFRSRDQSGASTGLHCLHKNFISFQPSFSLLLRVQKYNVTILNILYNSIFRFVYLSQNWFKVCNLSNIIELEENLDNNNFKLFLTVTLSQKQNSFYILTSSWIIFFLS